MSSAAVRNSKVVPLLFVVYGFTGDLMRRKLLLGLWNAWRELRREHCTEQPFTVIGCSRSKPESTTGYLNDAAEEFGVNRSIGNWDEFLNVFSFIPVGNTVESGEDLFSAIKAWKEAHPNGRVLFYLSVPYKANIPIVRQLAKFLDGGSYGEDVRILFEKPAEINVQAVDEIDSLLLKAGVAKKNAGIVEHFVLKHGFQQMLEWMYARLPHNRVLNGDCVRRVRIKVYEQVGMEGRDYPGIMVDSLYNHHAAILAAILGNPFDQGIVHIGEALRGRLERLLLSVPQGLSEVQSLEHQRAFYKALNPYGVYAHCHEDHGGDGEDIPTGVYLQYKPNANRWAGRTLFESLHVKNSPFKTTEVSFEFLENPVQPRISERWTFLIDGFMEGQRVWGWRKVSSALRADERNSEPIIEERFRPVPEEFVDGYPQVVLAFLRDEMHRFMPTDFQRAGIQVFGPWAEVLDQIPIKKRVQFHRGTDPFHGFNCPSARDHRAYLQDLLVPLVPQLETTAV